MLKKLLLGIVGACVLSTSALAQSATLPKRIVVSACPTTFGVGAYASYYATSAGVDCQAGSGGGGGAITGPLGNQAKAAAVSTTDATGSTIAPAVTALSTTAAIVLATGTGFVSRSLCNDDTAITIYFGGATVTNAGANGMRLLPGQCWDLSHNTANIYVVAASGTPNARSVQY